MVMMMIFDFDDACAVVDYDCHDDCTNQIIEALV